MRQSKIYWKEKKIAESDTVIFYATINKLVSQMLKSQSLRNTVFEKKNAKIGKSNYNAASCNIYMQFYAQLAQHNNQKNSQDWIPLTVEEIRT